MGTMADMIRRSYRRIRRGNYSQWLAATLTIVMFGAVGIWLLASSHAATPGVNREAEQGLLSGTCAVKVSDSTASGGQAVRLCVPSSNGGFVHPGIVLDKSQLNFVKAKLAANAAPWSSAYADLTTGSTRSFTAASYAAQPSSLLQCVGTSQRGSTTYQQTQAQCTGAMNDARAAYADALMYYYTGTQSYATTAVAILNAWSQAFTPTGNQQYCNDVSGINAKEQDASYGVDAAINFVPADYTTDCVGIVMSQTYTNGVLQAGWMGQTMVQAAEILRYTPGNGWATGDIQRFSTMLDAVLLPLVNHGWGGGANWLTTTADATMNIGVFNNNRATFNRGVADWQRSFTSVIYRTGDNNSCNGMSGYPIAPYANVACSRYNTTASMDTYWHTPGSYIDGLEGETCRDMLHTMMGLDGAVYGAETARIQGMNLYANGNAQRLAAGFELAARLDSAGLSHPNSDGTTYSTTSLPAQYQVCGGTITGGGQTATFTPGWDNGYHALHDIQGLDLPLTKTFLTDYKRQTHTDESTFMNWEQLTSASDD